MSTLARTSPGRVAATTVSAAAGAAYTRRRIGAGVIAGAGAAVLAVCGIGSASGTGPAAGAGGLRSITGPLAFWSNGGDTDPSWQAWQQRIADFKQSYPQADLFVTGALSAFITSTSFLITVANARDVDWLVWAPPPAPGVGRTHTWSAGFGKVVPSGVKNAEASFTLARYLTDEEMQRIQNRSGRLPTIKSVAKDPYWNTVDPRVKQFIELLAFSHSYTPILQSDLMTRELNTAETNVAKGKTTAKVALAEANQRVADAIRENRPE